VHIPSAQLTVADETVAVVVDELDDEPPQPEASRSDTAPTKTGRT
jgi:hypothetical protein